MQPQADYLLAVWKEAEENEGGGYARRTGSFLTVDYCRAAG